MGVNDGPELSFYIAGNLSLLNSLLLTICWISRKDVKQAGSSIYQLHLIFITFEQLFCYHRQTINLQNPPNQITIPNYHYF